MLGSVRNCSLIVLLICLALLVASATLAQDVVGSITDMKGAAHVKRNGQNLAVILGMTVNAHDMLHTTPGGNLTIALTNGDHLMLGESSSIVVNHQAFANHIHDHFMIELLDGHVRYTVERGALGTIPATEVKAPNAITVAHGTDFEVAYTEGKSCPDAPLCRRYTDISVYKGMVEVSNPADPKIPPAQVKQGYETAVPCDLPPTSPAPLAMDELGTPGYQ